MHSEDVAAPADLTPRFPGPNEEVLEAQRRVCTGPHQSRPLGDRPDDPQPDRVLELILRSAQGELTPVEQVSDAQMGAFFAAMTIRKGFEESTNWNEAERAAFTRCGDALERALPDHIRFLMDPGSDFDGEGPDEILTVRALRRILAGEHLDYETTRQLCEVILVGEVREGLKAAAIIGQRMNIESFEEVRGYCDAVVSPEATMEVSVQSLTHLGQPFDGNTRYLRSTPFVAAVRAACGESTVFHGVDELPPKRGITDEQILRALGAKTDLSLQQAAELLETPAVGFAYVSQEQYAPALYRLRELRNHIAKRPPWATTEKAQQLYVCPHDNYMAVGFFHAGYEEKLLGLMKGRGYRAGIVIKGEEGSTGYSLRLGKPSSEKRKAINFTQGFRAAEPKGGEFAADVDPAALGFNYDQNPRLEPVTAGSFARAGTRALEGEPGHVQDRIVLNAAMIDYWLGICPEKKESVARARAAIDDGTALEHMRAYIRFSATV